MPQEDLYMSNNHAFKYNGLWHHMKCSTVTKKVDLEELEYFHIIVEDYFTTTIVAENVEVETCFKYKEDNVMIVWSCTKTCCQPLKVVRGEDKVRAMKITLPESEMNNTNNNNTLDILNQLDAVKLSQDNQRNIQKLMNRPFDPRRDTYQLKKNIPMSGATGKVKAVVGGRYMTRSKANPEANANLLKKVNALLSKTF
jgi:hypothetical protein